MQTWYNPTLWLWAAATIGSWCACGDGGKAAAEQKAKADSLAALPGSINLQTSSLSELFRLTTLPLWLDDQGNARLKMETAPADSSLMRIETSMDFMNYLEKQKQLKNSRYNALELNNKIYNEFYGMDRGKFLSNGNLLQRGILNEWELKCYQLWFVLTLRDNGDTPQAAYQRIKNKLNDICRDCTALESGQMQSIEQRLQEEPNNFGVFELLSVQQMNSFGIL